jgi:hypothetical protein
MKKLKLKYFVIYKNEQIIALHKGHSWEDAVQRYVTKFKPTGFMFAVEAIPSKDYDPLTKVFIA